MGAIPYLAIRFTLWVSGVFVALFPTLVAAPSLPSVWPSETLQMLNAAGLFRDLFFIVVVVAVLALSSILDFMSVNMGKVVPTIHGIVIGALIFNIVALCSGLVGFMQIPHARTPVASSYGTYCSLIYLALLIGLATEIGVSWLNSKYTHVVRQSHSHKTGTVE